MTHYSLGVVEMVVGCSQIIDLGNPDMRPASPLASPAGSPFGGLGLQWEVLTHYVGSTPVNFYLRRKKTRLMRVYCVYGGDGGSRTHVRKHFHKTFSERSWCFVVSPLYTPISRLVNQLSRCSLTVPGDPARFSCIVDARFLAYR